MLESENEKAQAYALLPLDYRNNYSLSSFYDAAASTTAARTFPTTKPISRFYQPHEEGPPASKCYICTKVALFIGKISLFLRFSICYNLLLSATTCYNLLHAAT